MVALPIQPELEVENIVPVLTDPQILIGKKFTQSWADDTTQRVQNWNGYVSELVTNGNYEEYVLVYDEEPSQTTYLNVSEVIADMIVKDTIVFWE